MKVFFLGFFCLLCSSIAIAQRELLSFDEHNKYIYYQVVDMPSLNTDSLYARGLGYVKTNYPKLKLSLKNRNEISGEGKFLTYGGTAVLRHERGDIYYSIHLEFKDHKYRFWLSSFTFNPYERDRYGNFVPKPGINIPMETALSKLDKKDVTGYLHETGSFCKQFGDGLKQAEANVSTQKKEVTTKKVVTDKW